MISPISGTLPADWQEHAVTRQIDIYVGTNETLIPQTYIIMNSIEFTQSVCSDGKFHLGGVISSRLTFKVNTACITFGNDKLKVYEHIVLDDDSEYDIPLGVYFVDRTDSVITEDGNYFEGNYVAYDAFSRADKVVTQAEAEGFHTAHGTPSGETLYKLITWIENVIHLYAITATKTAISAHSNNSRPYINIEKKNSTYIEYGYYLYKAAENGLTYRDVLSSVAAMLGGAFVIDRTSNGFYYKLVPFVAGQTPVITLTASDRIRSSIDTHTGKPIIKEFVYGATTVSSPAAYNTYTDAQLSLGDLAIVQLNETSARPAQQVYVLQAAMETLMMQLDNLVRYVDTFIINGDPLSLTSAEIDYFGNPTLEAGDFIRCTTNSGNTDFYILEHVYKPHRPSTIRSYAEVNNSFYTNSRSPSYGEARRPSGYDAATAAQIARLSESSQDYSDEITSLQNDVSDINTDITGLDTRLTAAEAAIAAISTDVVYSTTERKIGKWIDDSDLYEKTIVISALSDGATRSVQVAHGIANLGEVVESRGQVITPNSIYFPLQQMPISSDGTSALATDATAYTIDRTNITITNGTTDRSGCKAYVTLRYTKKAIVPSWFPDVDPVDDLQTHFGNDMSNYYVDLALKITSGPASYLYTRCYCDTDNSVKVSTNNVSPPTQIFEGYTINGSKIAYRQVSYTNDGTVYNYYNQAWDSFSTIISNNFDPTKMCIVEQGNSYTVWAPTGYEFEII